MAQRGASRRGKVAVLFVIVCQMRERVERALMRCLAPRQRPLFKFRAALQKKLLKKFAAIQVNRLLHLRRAKRARFNVCMRVPFARGEVRVKFLNVEGMVARGVELNFVARDKEKRGLCGVVANRSTQIKEGLAQIVPRRFFGVIGP